MVVPEKSFHKASSQITHVEVLRQLELVHHCSVSSYCCLPSDDMAKCRLWCGLVVVVVVVVFLIVVAVVMGAVLNMDCE